MSQYTISGRVVFCGGAPLQGYPVIATAEYIVTILIDLREGRQPKSQSSRQYVRIGETLTDSDGRFSLTFDPDQLRPETPGEDSSISAVPKVSVRVLEPDTNFPLAARGYKTPPYNFSISVTPVSVLDWQLHYPSGESEFILGDIAVLTANVRNNFSREVQDLGLHVSLSPKCLDDPSANARRNLADPFEIKVTTDIVLEPAGSPQEGRIRYDPNPLDTQPVAIALQIPRKVTIVDDQIPGDEYTFAPSGLYRLEAHLLLSEIPCSSAAYEVCVRPGPSRDQPGRCDCSGVTKLRTVGVVRPVFVAKRHLTKRCS